jgi:hypothetical protein
MQRKKQFAARLALEADRVAPHVLGQPLRAAHKYMEKSQMIGKIVLNRLSAL